MEGGYKIVDFDFEGRRSRMVCDGPQGPTMLTTILNCSLLNNVIEISGALRPYFTFEEVRTSVEHILNYNISLTTKAIVMNSGSAESVERKLEAIQTEKNLREIFGGVLANLTPQEFVTPKLSSVTSFEKCDNVALFSIMGFPLLHGWLVNPEDIDIVPFARDYNYEQLQKYNAVLQSQKEFGVEENSNAFVLTKALLDAHVKQLTKYGYDTLCRTLKDGDLAVLYWDRKFNVLHKDNGNLLLLETDPKILEQYSTVRWRVFKEVDGDIGYLTDCYLPADVVITVGSGPETQHPASNRTLKRRARRTAKKLSGRLAQNAPECTSNPALVEELQQDEKSSMPAPTQDREAPMAASITSDSDQVDSDGSSTDLGAERLAQNVPECTSNPALVEELQQEKTCMPAPGQDHEAPMASSIFSDADQVDSDGCNTDLGADFLEFLLQFRDGGSKLKEGSSTETVPYFEGVREALKHTGSPKFYVPFEFIEMHNRSLAMKIQKNYPRVSEELTESVRLYLGDLEIGISAELHILHLPKSRTGPEEREEEEKEKKQTKINDRQFDERKNNSTCV